MSQEESNIKNEFRRLVFEHPEDIKSLGENDFNLIANMMDKNQLREALSLLAIEKEKSSGEGNRKTYPTVTVNGVTWMTENLAYDDGEEGIINFKGKYYYQQFAANRVAKKLGWVLPSPETWNALCEAKNGELLNPDVGDPIQYNYVVPSLFNKINCKYPIGFLNNKGELKEPNNNVFWTNRKEGNSVVVRETYYPKRSIVSKVLNQNNYLPVRLIRG